MNANEASANKFYNITGNGSTTLDGKLVLIRVVVNTKGGSSNTATVYADAYPTPEYKIGKIDTTASVTSIEYGIPCLTGIHIVTATGTAADLTVVYKETA